MKRLFSIFVIILLLLSLVACENTSDDNSTASSESSESVESSKPSTEDESTEPEDSSAVESESSSESSEPESSEPEVSKPEQSVPDAEPFFANTAAFANIIKATTRTWYSADPLEFKNAETKDIIADYVLAWPLFGNGIYNNMGGKRTYVTDPLGKFAMFGPNGSYLFDAQKVQWITEKMFGREMDFSASDIHYFHNGKLYVSGTAVGDIMISQKSFSYEYTRIEGTNDYEFRFVEVLISEMNDGPEWTATYTFIAEPKHDGKVNYWQIKSFDKIINEP